MNALGIATGFARALATAALLAATTGTACAATFANASAITIVDQSPASPSPSTIAVSGLSSNVTKVTVTISGLSHSFPDDIAAVLVGPTGVQVTLFDGPGESADANNLTWTFDDAASLQLPSSGTLVSGSFRAMNQYGSSFSGLPAGTRGTLLSAFNGLNPNGLWSLYVEDFVVGDVGNISGGWSLSVTAAPLNTVPEPASWGMMLAGFGLVGATLRLRGRRRSLTGESHRAPTPLAPSLPGH
jgi:subtilisin-like proprotein convertase family protein